MNRNMYMIARPTNWDVLEDFYKDINSPTTLRELGIKEEDIEKIAENASRGETFGTLKKLDADDVLEIYKLAY